ncbi:MAG: hypothetical protein NTW96_05225 [Planctomycetia bacterium]|nr:hypothetical protein [Planctomycetia bacterium]
MDPTFPYVSRRKYSETEGVNEAWTVDIKAIGKDNSENPYLIPNEWIAASIARFLGVPVPPFAIMSKMGRRSAMFASISFEGDTTPRDVVPSILWEKHPRLCTGILVFDILIANCDRHAGNIKVDDPAAPKRVHVFDHDRALFHMFRGEGIKRLKAMEGRLGISGGSVSQGSRHCLIDEVNTADHFAYWLQRMETMPAWFIEDVCFQVRGLGAKKREAETVADFLNRRREQLGSLIQNNRAEFPSINDWQLFL